MKNKKKIVVIIVAYNGEAWIEKCIESLFSGDLLPHVVVIDNSSTDSTVKFIKKYPNVEIILSKINLGFGRANNIGLNRALELGAEYVLLLNQDALVEEKTIETLVSVASGLPDNIGLMTPLHLSYEGDAIEHQFYKHYLSRQKADYFSDLLFNDVKEYYTPFASNAAAWLIKRSTLLAVGGFDPLFFMYGEDDDYRARLDYHNIKSALIPRARIRHWSGHRTRISKPKEQSIRKRSNRIYSNCIREIKDPRLSYKLALYRGITRTIMNGMLLPVNKRNLKEIAATLLGLGRSVLRIPSILRHKKLTREKGAFLDLADN